MVLSIHCETIYLQSRYNGSSLSCQAAEPSQVLISAMLAMPQSRRPVSTISFAVTFSLVAACLLLQSASAEARGSSPGPGIVLLVADDLGFSDWGCSGGEIPAPQLDQLATKNPHGVAPVSNLVQ